MKEKINELIGHAENGQIEVIYREGKAQELLKPVEPLQKQPLQINGNYGTVLAFLKKRAHLFEPDNCNINVCLNGNYIVFTGNECQGNNEYPTIVRSELHLTKEIKNLEINNEAEFEPMELAKYLRKRKNLFPDPEEFGSVFTALSSFKAEVQRQIEKADDRSGNATNLIKQQVTSNLPKKFGLKLRPFENVEEKILFEVEIDVNPHSLECSLLSFDLDEKLDKLRRNNK